jgi:hypothetical protein
LDKPLCASLDGLTLHAATRAGALDTTGREALLRYELRPPIAQERVTQGPEGLVRITLKKAWADGTVAVDMDPLSLLCRLAASVAALRFQHRPLLPTWLRCAMEAGPVLPRPPESACTDHVGAHVRPPVLMYTRTIIVLTRLSLRGARRAEQRSRLGAACGDPIG